MSSYATHALIGAVGGLALLRVIPAPAGVLLGSHDLAVPPSIVQVVIVSVSAVAALWPDIDEPRSFIGQHVRRTITILMGLLCALVGFSLASLLAVAYPATTAVALLLGGAGGFALGVGLLGPLLGWGVMRALRTAAGGHRRLTHSLCLSGPPALLAYMIWWGQWLHLLGDLVTPAGVPLLYPCSTRSFRVFPRALAAFGEPIIAALAVLCGEPAFRWLTA